MDKSRVDIIVRDMREEDIPFICSTWLLGLRHGNEFFGMTEKDSYFLNYHKVIGVYLGRSEVKLTCLKDDPDVILGYAVYRDNVLHWVFVKKSWRRLGLAKALLPKTINVVTHLTELGEKIKPKGWKFDPFVV